MPWMETSSMKERARFCVEVEAGDESFAALCRRYGVSRKTGYKWWTRYQAEGPLGLSDQNRAPSVHPNETPAEVVEQILEVRRSHPSWGPKKIVAWLLRNEPEVATPVASTVGQILKRHGVVSPRRRTVKVARSPTPLTASDGPNSVWTVDFKGQFPLKGGQTCWPLTLMDLHSRYLLRCQALGSTRFRVVRPVLLAAFQEFGLPLVIRSDNGSPFASRAPGGLSAMAVWLLRLGIRPERIAPGCPTQNGAHERMHRTLKAETTEPRCTDLVGQQRCFSRFERVYNHERPHEALDLTPPSDHYGLSGRAYPRLLRVPEYPKDFEVIDVYESGQAQFNGHRLYVGRNLAELQLGLYPHEGDTWQLWFMDYCLGIVDLSKKGLQRPSPAPKGILPPTEILWK
jgi:transposase InsO family protein